MQTFIYRWRSWKEMCSSAMDKLTLSLVTWWSLALLKCQITWNTFQVKILLFSQYFCLSFCLPQGKVLGIEIHYFQKPMPCKGDGRSEISQWEQKAGSHLAHDPNSSPNQEIGNLDTHEKVPLHLFKEACSLRHRWGSCQHGQPLL